MYICLEPPFGCQISATGYVFWWLRLLRISKFTSLEWSYCWPCRSLTVIFFVSMFVVKSKAAGNSNSWSNMTGCFFSDRCCFTNIPKTSWTKKPQKIGRRAPKGDEQKSSETYWSRWWFHFLNFHPNLGKWSNLTNMFEMGWLWLVQPPTSDFHTVFFEKNIRRSPPRNGAKTL